MVPSLFLLALLGGGLAPLALENPPSREVQALPCKGCLVERCRPAHTETSPYTPFKGGIHRFSSVVAPPSGLGNFSVILSPKRSKSLNFSHRFHLNQTKASCQDCHANAWISTSSQDNNLPAEKDCLQCHDGSKARKECTLCHADSANARPLPLPARNVRFNHQLHGELGNLAPVLAAAMDSGSYLSPGKEIRDQLDTSNSCVACHRGLTETDFSGPANLPRMADCLVCHAEINPPFSCEFCHTKEARIKPQSHTPDYIDAHSRRSARRDTQSCKICHGVNFRCMGCH